jgi:hypothetical protein
MSTESASLRDGSQLCTACGLCCNGVLHPYATLFDAEIEQAREIGLDVFSHEGWPAFHLPCTRLDGAHCTVYERRPRVCAAFRCRLLRRLHDGEVGLDEALAIVGEAKASVEVIQACVGPGEPLVSAWEQIRQTGEVAAEQGCARSPSFVQSVSLLTELVREHF